MNTGSLEALVGLFIPLLISVLKREHYAQTTNALIAVGVYIVTGVVAVLVSGQPFDVNNIVPSVTQFAAEGTFAYQLFWKNYGDPQIAAAFAKPTP